MGTGVIVAHFHIDRQIRSGNLNDATVTVMVVDHHQRMAAGILPQKDGWNIRRGARRIHSDIQKLHAVPGERADDAAGVAGDVRHLGAGGGALEALVERARQTQRAFDQRAVHQLGLPGEGKRVPGDIPGCQGLLHQRPPRHGPFEVFVDQPRAGGPDVAIVSLPPHGSRRLDGQREVLLEVFLYDIGLCIDEPHVQVALEHHQDPLHRGVGRG
jgi:hypothetical protein